MTKYGNLLKPEVGDEIYVQNRERAWVKVTVDTIDGGYVLCRLPDNWITWVNWYDGGRTWHPSAEAAA